MMPGKEQIVPIFDEFPSYKGGHTTVYGGYVYEFCPGHPLQNRWGWVAQHRMIGEDIIGRPLIQHSNPAIRECVHHIDECRTNNDPKNLQILTFSAHRSHHTKKRNEEFYTPRRATADQVRNALEGRSIKEAAEFLGCHHQTLRNHHSDVLAPRKRKSPVRMHAPTPEEMAIVRRYAADPQLSLRECKAAAHMAERTILRLCAKMGIEWIRKSKKGEVKKTYRGKPSRTYLAACASKTESATRQPTEQAQLL